MEKSKFKFFKTIFARGYLNIHDNLLEDYIQSTKTIKHHHFLNSNYQKEKTLNAFILNRLDIRQKVMTTKCA